jgi:multicomponent Na+:H+ antiporter subunit F
MIAGFDEAYLIALGVIFLSVIMSIIRIVKGPTAPDRVVGIDTVNTLIIVGMIIFGISAGLVIYIDVAIVYAFLSFISTLFIAKYLEGGDM